MARTFAHGKEMKKKTMKNNKQVVLHTSLEDLLYLISYDEDKAYRKNRQKILARSKKPIFDVEEGENNEHE